MKRHGNLWPLIASRENVAWAFDRAQKGKRWQKGIQQAELRREKLIDACTDLLVSNTFTTSEYRQKQVYEPKERTVYILPYYPDRIVQHSLMRVVAPIWDRMFDNGSFACRPKRGQHTASQRCMAAVRQYPWVMHADVRKFYPSIRHDLLMKVIERKIKDPNVLRLFDDIIHSFPGSRNLPIGNLTSQWCGALFLNELDRFVRAELRPCDYLRYSDDFLLFFRTKGEANKAQEACRSFLAQELDLIMAKERVYPTRLGVDFVGYRHYREGYKLVRSSTARRMKRRIRQIRKMWAKGIMDAVQVKSVVVSIRGWLGWANTYNLGAALGLAELEALADEAVR